MSKFYKSIGLMSGTSMDGIDLAMLETDGVEIKDEKKFAYVAYEDDFKKQLRHLIYDNPTLSEIKSFENKLTLLHADFVNLFLKKNRISPAEVDLIAFHGHTILHNPKQGVTWQIGNGHLLAEATQIDVMTDFRSRDIVLGGQGAPLVPIYHFHLLQNKVELPTAAINIGGISNITYFDQHDKSSIKAFDVCFGNAPCDDLMKKKMGQDFDHNGKLAKSGHVDFIIADRILQNEIFHQKPPKSFDRDDFASILAPINNLKIEDALATFAYMHAKALQINLEFLNKKPKEIFVCGGGRKNLAIMDEMRKWLTGINVRPIEDLGFNGDSIEAEAFAFLGVRNLLKLPISFKETSGITMRDSSFGGVLYYRP